MGTLLIAVPTFETIDPEVFKAIYDLTVPDRFNSVDFEFVRGYDCARARNMIAKKAIEGKHEYVLMVDSDTVIPTHTLTSFLQQNCDADVILGIYPRKGSRRRSEIFSFNTEGYSEACQYSFNELEQLRDRIGATKVTIKGGGLGCALIKTSTFAKLLMPYFLYVTYPNGEALSEDLFFCEKVRDAGGSIVVDTRVFCGHVKKTTLWE